MAKASIGQMDRRVQFRRASLVDDGFSGVEVFADHGSPVWAAKMDISTGESWRSSEVAAIVSTRFSVRYSDFTAGITASDRLVCDGTTYGIAGVKEIERRSVLEISAVARSD